MLNEQTIFDALTLPNSWNGATNLQANWGKSVSLTYKFLSNNSLPVYTGTPDRQNVAIDNTSIRSFSSSEEAAAERIMKSWMTVANIFITEAVDNAPSANIYFANAEFTEPDTPYEGSTDFYSNNANATLWMNSTATFGMAYGEIGYSLMNHEFGHVLGLNHPNGNDYDEDTIHTNMSYTDDVGITTDGVKWRPCEPMLYDIFAVQKLYGANPNTNTGDDSYTFKTGVDAIQAIWDAGGAGDEINASDQTNSVTINLTPGEFSFVGTVETTSQQRIAIAYQVSGQENNWIENAIGGSGADKLTGNDGNNELKGGEGDDILDSGKGNDSLYGGGGNDILKGGEGYDRYFAGNGDAIDDTDGYGKVYFADKPLNGGTKKAGETDWKDAAGHTYTMLGGKLFVKDGDSLIVIENFLNHRLGIHLIDATPRSPVTSLNLIGDLALLDIDLATDGLQLCYDDLGNWLRNLDQPNLNYSDTLSGGGGSDWIQGFGGSDKLQGQGSDDVLEGGADSDILSGGAGDDVLYADSKADLATVYESDTVPSGSTRDWLAGGDGDDQLFGSAGSDGLFGGNRISYLVG